MFAMFAKTDRLKNCSIFFVLHCLNLKYEVRSFLWQGCKLGQFLYRVEVGVRAQLGYEFDFKFEFKIVIFATSCSSSEKIHQVLSGSENKAINLSTFAVKR